jgi:hypothetical protein
LVEPLELDRIPVLHWKKSVDLIEPQCGPLGEQGYEDMLGLFATLPWEIAPLIEEEPWRGPVNWFAR